MVFHLNSKDSRGHKFIGKCIYFVRFTMSMSSMLKGVCVVQNKLDTQTHASNIFPGHQLISQLSSLTVNFDTPLIFENVSATEYRAPSAQSFWGLSTKTLN